MSLGSGNYNACFTLVNVSQPNPPAAGIIPATGAKVVAVNYKDTTTISGSYGFYGVQYPLYTVNANPLYQQGTYAPTRTDSSGTTTTSGSTTVGDTNAVSGDNGKVITGTGIPVGAVIAKVTASTGYVISVPATATGTPTLTIGGIPPASMYGEGWFYGTDTQVLWHSNGVAWTSTNSSSVPAAPNVQVFGSASTSGSFTWTKPAAMLYCDVIAIARPLGAGPGRAGRRALSAPAAAVPQAATLSPAGS